MAVSPQIVAFQTAPARPVSEPLTDAEFVCVQRYCEQLINEALSLELSVHVETDFRAFANYRGGVGDGFCYPSFDPARCRIGRADFWLRLVNDAGDTVAANATRIFADVEDFFQLVRTEALWSDRLPRVVGRSEPVCSISPFGGVIAHFGGLWVEPSQRGRGLAKLLPALARGLALRNLSFDFDTSLVFEPLVGLALGQYQYPRCELVIDGYFPPTGKSERVYLCQMSRAEALTSMGLAAVDDRESLGAVA
jgi:hypothetical protein